MLFRVKTIKIRHFEFANKNFIVNKLLFVLRLTSTM